MKLLQQNDTNLKRKLNASEEEEEKKRFLQNKKFVDDIAIAKNVKHVESLRYGNNILTKVLNRTLEGMLV